MKTFFGSMYEISSYMKTFFGSMYEISSYYDRDFLIHEIFISWRFHDPYCVCISVIASVVFVFGSGAVRVGLTIISLVSRSHTEGREKTVCQ